MEDNKISQENTKATSTTATFFADHKLPMQDEFMMKNDDGDGDGNGKNSLMDAVQLQIEMEKRKIREEIIVSEIIQRRQELEAEVRMEIMMEKQIMGMRNFYRADPYSYMLMNSGFLGFHKGGSFFHKNLLNVGSSGDDFGENMRLISHTHPVVPEGVDHSLQINSDPPKNNVLDVAMGKWPFERDTSLVAAQVAGKSMAALGGDEVLGQAMPSSGFSGMKRKAETSEVVCDEGTASVESKESQKKKWYCPLCDVSATSAGGLNLHLHGKKHKAKEAMSKSGVNATASSASTDRCSAENSMQPMEEDKGQVLPMEEEKSQVQPVKEEKSQMQSMEEDESQVQPMKEGDKSQVTKKWECSLCQISATSETLLRSHLRGKKHKAKEAKLGVIQGSSDIFTETAKEKSEDAKEWYCSLCKVSAASEKNLNDHLQGKKHKAKEGLLLPEADSVDSDSRERSSEDVKIVREKSLDGEESLKNEQETSMELGKSQVSEHKTVNLSNMVKIESEWKKQKTSDRAIVESEELETRKELVKLWHCKVCNEGTYDQATMATHRKSSKHRNLLRKIGGGVIVVSSVLKEAVNSEGASQNVALEGK